MAKVDYSGVPEVGSKWEFDDLTAIVIAFKAKGRGGYVHWESESAAIGGQMIWSEWKKKAKAA